MAFYTRGGSDGGLAGFRHDLDVPESVGVVRVCSQEPSPVREEPKKPAFPKLPRIVRGLGFTPPNEQFSEYLNGQPHSLEE